VQAQISFLDFYEGLVCRKFTENELQFIAPPRGMRRGSGATNKKFLAKGGGIV
jgi:hypothetical protein